MWLRFVLFHPRMVDPEAALGAETVRALAELGLQADALARTCSVAGNADVVCLCDAAEEFAMRYHQAVRALVERFAPRLADRDPFAPTSVAHLLALPPHDGVAATVDALEEVVGAGFGST